jgi:hypothetical protein
MISVLLLFLSGLKGLDLLFGLGVIPAWGVTEPVYFLAAFAKYTLLSAAALFVAVPRGERWPLIPIAPLYLFYSMVQIVPTTVGYANWFSLRLCGRRIWGDHYQDGESLLREHQQRHLARGVAAP